MPAELRFTSSQALAFAELMGQVGTPRALELRERFLDLAVERAGESEPVVNGHSGERCIHRVATGQNIMHLTGR